MIKDPSINNSYSVISIGMLGLMRVSFVVLWIANMGCLIVIIINPPVYEKRSDQFIYLTGLMNAVFNVPLLCGKFAEYL